LRRRWLCRGLLISAPEVEKDYFDDFGTVAGYASPDDVCSSEISA
jgi:hypothetical protein